jgi:hypothetical protein
VVFCGFTGLRGHDKPSIQVFSYHSKEETFDTMSNFVQWLDVSVLLPYEVMELSSLVSDITRTKPDYVVFSADIEVFKDSNEIKNLMQQYQTYLKDMEACIGKRN